MKRLGILGCLAFAASSWAVPPDFLPLQVGNEWVLQTASATPQVLHIEILRSRTLNGHIYFLVSGYLTQDRWLRRSDEGTLYVFDENSGADVILAQLVIGSGSYKTAVSGCEQPAQALAEPVRYRGPYLDASAALVIQYEPGQCRDVGFTSETYAPGVGLMHRSTTTIRGEITFDLVYARVSGAPVVGRSNEIVLKNDFNSGSKGWLAGFSDYGLKTNDLRMLAELRHLPDEVSQTRSGFYMQSVNRSDDVFMFLKKHVSADDGLQSNQAYRVWFEITFASDAPAGCAGVGGAPGDSVYLKAGATADEPLALLSSTGNVQLSVDKGQQATGGKDAGMAGTIANGTTCEGKDWPYISVTRNYTHAREVRTDDRGVLWLLVGTDSGYEGLTGLYIQSITVRMSPAGSASGASARRRKP